MADTPKKGLPFSQQYLARGEAADDSPRARNRLAAYLSYKNFETHVIASIAAKLREELAANIEHSAHVGSEFYGSAQIVDVLDSVTHIYQALNSSSGRSSQKANAWLRFVANVFETENLSYEVDEEGGVHHKVDAEFQHPATSILRGLTDSKYGAVRQAFEQAHVYIESTPPDTKGAVRSMFESVEILARLMVPGTRNLNKALVENALKKIALEHFKNDTVAARAAAGIFDGAARWVDALHIYRHGQPTEIPLAPPLDFAVYVLSSGAALLRLMLDIDRG